MTRIPGLRFHPTNDELINYYLKRKVLGKQIPEIISEIEIYKCAPWDLPDMSYLRTKDREWYFFCPMARKYSNGDRMNRATEFGFWKATGNDRPVKRRDQTVGRIKTLVFHTGKAPNGGRTDWVMHEYRLADKDLAAAGVVQDSYVICKLFQKSGPGPNNGAQYGAPYNEEEWSDGEEVAGIESFSLAGLLASTPARQNYQQKSAMTSTFICGTMCIGSSSRSNLSNMQRTDYMLGPVQDNNVSPAPNHQQSSAVASTFISGTMSIGASSGSTLSNMGPTNNMLIPAQEYNVSPALNNTNQQSSAMTSTFVSGSMSARSSFGSTLSNMRPSDNMLRPVQEYNVSPAVQNHQQNSAVTSKFSGTMSIGSSSAPSSSNMRPIENMFKPVQNNNNALMPELPLPVNNDAVLISDWSSDVIIPVQNGNNQNEVLYNVIGEDSIEASPDDDYYNCLAVPTWDDMYINSSSFSSFAYDSLNDASYLELNDLQSPLVPRQKDEQC